MSDPRRDWLWKMLIEVVLIGVAVFLGMAADQWRTDRQERAAARAALQRIRVEIQKNQAEVQRVKDYHVTVRQGIIGYLDPKTRKTTNLSMKVGINPARFEHTAWDLALATQALANIDPDIALELTGIYGLQQLCDGLATGLAHAMYIRPPGENFDGFMQSVKVFYDDMVVHEPALLEKYGHVLPVIDSALRD